MQRDKNKAKSVSHRADKARNHNPLFQPEDDRKLEMSHSCASGSSVFVDFTPSNEMNAQDLQTGDSNYQPNCLVDHPYSSLKAQLYRSGRCDDFPCLDESCQQIKTLLHEIEVSWKADSAALSDTHRHLMALVDEHSASCDHPACPYFWCLRFDSRDCDSLKTADRVEEIQPKMFNLVAGWSMDVIRPTTHFIKFDLNVPLNNLLRSEEEPWTRLCMMGRSHKAMLVKPHTQYCNQSRQYWVVKKVIDYDTWEVYERLQPLQKTGIISPLLWVAGFDGYLVTCSEFEGMSLYECLQEIKKRQPDVMLTLRVLLQLAFILQQLHRRNIVFLNWSSRNIMISQNATGQLKVKLINFDCSALVGITEDAGVKLPLHLHPPEFSEDTSVKNVKTDMWGVGCLLYEMTAGDCVWHQYRHQSGDELEGLMREKIHPDLPENCSHLSPIFNACWETNPDERPSASQLHRLVLESMQHLRKNRCT